MNDDEAEVTKQQQISQRNQDGVRAVTTGSSSGQCYACGGLDYWVRHCPNKNPVTDAGTTGNGSTDVTSRPRGLCFACKGPHAVSECPNKWTDREGRPRGPCHKCGGSHLIYDCPSPSRDIVRTDTPMRKASFRQDAVNKATEMCGKVAEISSDRENCAAGQLPENSETAEVGSSISSRERE